jgi:hypothetical protein
VPLTENRTPHELADCCLENMQEGDQDCGSAVRQNEVGQKSALPNRGASGIIGGLDITFRRDRRVVINLCVRLVSFIYREIVLLSGFPSAPTRSQP